MKRIFLTLTLLGSSAAQAIDMPSLNQIKDYVNDMSWNEKVATTCFATAGIYAISHPKKLVNSAGCITRWAGEHPGATALGLTAYGIAFYQYPRVAFGGLLMNIGIIYQYQVSSEKNRELIAQWNSEVGDAPISIATRLEELELPEEVRKEVDRELSRMNYTSYENASLIKDYLEWLVELPWGIETEDNLDITHAKQILDEDHYGLDKIKERILDYIATRQLTQDNSAPIICLLGPPGTGKTSLARSIARSLGKNFQRISVGGVNDEAEIRGHRRTYIGAIPGSIVESVRRAGSMNPVILIDEIDKISNNSHQGNPAAALLEVLDPEQNSTFRDHYLGVPFDLSKVLFVTTANSLDTIPRPLRDRMEVIEVSGYSLEEKREIAKDYLVKKAIISAGLDEQSVEISEGVLTTIIRDYTMESGVRELERLLKKLCAKAARAFVETSELLTFTPDNLTQYLGPKKLHQDDISKENKVGITNGLAWTSVGGVMLKVEAVAVPGKGKLILTGSLGNVMKESAQAAMTYAKAHADKYGISQKKFADYNMHIHFPAGGIPKDGPSAGITILTSVISALTGRKVNGSYAMTGELNLRGDVMPIGGVKEKILAAKRNNITKVMIPQRNSIDLVEIKDLIKDVEVILVSNADEVLNKVLI